MASLEDQLRQQVEKKYRLGQPSRLATAMILRPVPPYVRASFAQYGDRAKDAQGWYIFIDLPMSEAQPAAKKIQRSLLSPQKRDDTHGFDTRMEPMFFGSADGEIGMLPPLVKPKMDRMAQLDRLASDVIAELREGTLVTGAENNRVLLDMAAKGRLLTKAVAAALKELAPLAKDPPGSVGRTAIRDLTVLKGALDRIVGRDAPYVWEVLDPSTPMRHRG